jgi:all-trans-retinol 13,14-reductase
VFDTGVHYLAGAGTDPGPDGQFGRLMHALSGGALHFTPIADPYDIVRLPGFEFGIAHPRERYVAALKQRFAAEHAAIDAWFAQLDRARQLAFAWMAQRALPPWAAAALRWWRGDEVAQFTHLTVARALQDSGLRDPALRAVLATRWGDYGAPPETAPLLEHALVTGAYDAGAWYPVGGPARFAQTLQPVIESAGGALLTGRTVTRIVVDDGRVSGVATRASDDPDGGSGRAAAGEQTHHAAVVISTMGVHNTVAALPPDAAPAWQHTLAAMRPGLASVSLYLGFEGDIAAAGAGTANVWVHEAAEVGRLWREPADEDAPSFFVSFPSLKDPQGAGAPTGEVIAFVDTAMFDPWLRQPPDAPRDETYAALKDWITQRLVAQFGRHFPALTPLLRWQELATPVTQRRYVHTPGGSTYGLEIGTARMDEPALQVRTPLAGLLLAGQDIAGPGVPPCAFSGVLAAAAVAPAVLRLFR